MSTIKISNVKCNLSSSKTFTRKTLNNNKERRSENEKMDVTTGYFNVLRNYDKSGYCSKWPNGAS